MEEVKQNEELERILELIKDLPAQEIINNCISDRGLNILCNKYENEIWTFLLQRDYPKWGITGVPKEYYIRIAQINGIHLRDTSKYSGIPGEKFLEEQTRRPFLQLQIGEEYPFDIPDVLARAYSTVLSTFLDFNINNNVKDSWIFHIRSEDLISKESSDSVSDYFRRIFHDNLEGHIEPDYELDVISVTNILQCKALLCDSLIAVIESRMTRLTNDIIEKNEIFQEEVDFIRIQFDLAPGYVAKYLKAMSNLLYRAESFNEEIVAYYREIIKAIPNISVALIPDGYPFTKRENLDKFDSKLFIIDVLKQPVISPDYLSANVCAALDTSQTERDGHEIRLWKNGNPPPVINSFPSQEQMLQRIEIAFPSINSILTVMTQIIRENFPKGEAGFIMAGGLPSMILDDWLCDPRTFWLKKTDVDLFIYGIDEPSRIKAYNIIYDFLNKVIPKEFNFSIWQSVLTISKRELLDKNYKVVPMNAPEQDEDEPKFQKRRYVMEIGMQIINTNSIDGFEIIMNFDTSNIQVGWDCWKGWIATPYWQLYYPRREALLVRYNIRSPRLAKTIFKGFQIKMLMPHALILTPKGTDYSQVLRRDSPIIILPNHKSSYADDFMLYAGHVRIDHIAGTFEDEEGEVKPYRYKSEPQQDSKELKAIVAGKETRIVITPHVKQGNKDEPFPSFISHLPRNDAAVVKLRDTIKFSGQFKNGFDAYVNKRYLTYDLYGLDLRKISKAKAGVVKDIDVNNLSLEQIIKEIDVLPHVRFIMRDCRFIADPTIIPLKFDGTNNMNFSIRVDILKKRNDYGYDTDFTRILAYGSKAMQKIAERYGRNPEKDVAKGYYIYLDNSYRSEEVGKFATVVKADFSDPTKDQELLQIKPSVNTKIIRKMFPFPIEIEGIIKLKPSIRENGRKSYVYYHRTYARWPKNSYKRVDSDLLSYNIGNGGDFKEISQEELDHFNSKEFKEELPYDYVKVLINEEFDVDSIDLHDRFYSDEERERLPLFDHRQWQEIRVGKIKLPANVSAIRIRSSVIIQESIFLDENDWTIDTEYIIANRDKFMFNCLCYQNATIMKEEGLALGEISVFRAFKVFE